MNREKNLLKNTIILGIGTMLPKLCTFITLPIYTMYLSKMEYGTFDLVNTLISLVIPIATLQIHQASFRFLIKEKDTLRKKAIVTNTYVFATIMILLMNIILFFSLKWISSQYIYLIMIYITISMYQNIALQICRGFGKNSNYSIASIINIISNLVVVIPVLIVWRLGLNGLIISLTISIFLSLLYILINIKILLYFDIKLVSKNIIISLLKYSIPMVPNTISWWIVNVSDRMIITAILGVEANAIYAVSNKIPSIYQLFYNTFNLAWQESATLANDDNDVSKYYSNVFEGLFSILTGTMLILIASTPILFKFLIKGEYAEAYYQIPILFVAMYFASFANFYGGIYIANKNTRSMGITSILSAIINILINILLINILKLYAASFSTLMAYFTITVYRAIDSRKMVKIKYAFDKIIICFLALTISSILCFINTRITIISNIILAMTIGYLINKNIIKNIITKVLEKIK